MSEFSNEFRRLGYDKEEEYFYRLNHEIIEEARQRTAEIRQEDSTPRTPQATETHLAFFRLLRRRLKNFHYREIDPHYF